MHLYASLLSLAVLTGVSGYAFNVVVGRIFGPTFLGQLMSGVGVVSLLTLPASLLVFPAAQWARQQARPRNVQVAAAMAILPGLASGAVLWGLRSAWPALPGVPSGSVWPLALWVVPLYLFNFNIGVLISRSRYRIVEAVGACPQVAKLVAVAVGVWFGQSTNVLPYWAFCIGGWLGAMASVVGVAACVDDVVGQAPVERRLWASSITSLVMSAWNLAEMPLVAWVLTPKALGVYAVAVLYARIPYHLTMPAVTVGAGESGWNRERPWRTRLLILAVGGACVGLVALNSKLAMSFFGLSSGSSILLERMFAGLVLALAYYEVTAWGQRGIHAWGGPAFALIVWSSLIMLTRPSITALTLELIGCLVGALAIMAAMRRAVPPRSQAAEVAT